MFGEFKSGRGDSFFVGRKESSFQLSLFYHFFQYHFIYSVIILLLLMVRITKSVKQNFRVAKVWVAVSSLVLGALSLLQFLAEVPVLSILGSVIYTLVNLPQQVLYSLLSGALQERVIANELFNLLGSYLNFFTVGLMISLLLYRKYGKIVYWSILFTLPTFLFFGLAALISDIAGLESIMPLPLLFLYRILSVVSAPAGYYLGLYAGSKIKNK